MAPVPDAPIEGRSAPLDHRPPKPRGRLRAGRWARWCLHAGVVLIIIGAEIAALLPLVP
ncbi:MAG: hypothetical protein JWO31_962, partial [Phycisphaerales bacterium]|nr:hypothetical protein [Phycisphaerales bacterium]